MELIRKFEQLGKGDVALAGGKGASLGEMTQAGIPVPPGFVILAGTFERFIQETDLNVEIDAILDAVNHKEIHTVENASEKIQALIHGAEMPGDIATEINKFFKNLDTQYVAVRSSATAEDSSAAAWAGQLDSFLNTTEATLLENVQKCWASLFTPRAIFYRFEKELHKQKISVAVVVQKMVESEVSGIAFSVHPVTQDYNQLIIEAGLGLGEAIVSGSITPDSYVVEKSPRRILDKNVSLQERGLYRSTSSRQAGSGQANEWRDIPKDQGERQVLNDTQIEELSQIVLGIEKHYGFPVDIEWAFEKGKFYIVQSRPITTLQKQKELIPLVKTITREVPLIGVESWYEGFVRENERFFGIKFPENFFIFKNGTVESWRDSHRLSKTPLELSGWVKENRGKLVEAYRSQLATLKIVDNIVSRAHNSQKEVLASLNDIISSFASGFPGIVVTYLMPLWQEVFSGKGDNLFDDDIIKECSEWRKDTDQFFDRSTETIFQLLNRIAEINKWEKDLIKYIRYDELLLAIKNEKMNHDEILRRKRSVFAYIDGQLVFEEGFANELAKRGFSMPRETIHGSTEIKGVSANKGFVRGKVAVVFSRDELSKVSEDHILVAPMTTPWYLSAMHKAAAFVTDEGGITCHAAIISRELNKPCIIGTKIATQVLHDGDLVEVDADRGVVRLIKKA